MSTPSRYLGTANADTVNKSYRNPDKDYNNSLEQSSSDCMAYVTD